MSGSVLVACLAHRSPNIMAVYVPQASLCPLISQTATDQLRLAFISRVEKPKPLGAIPPSAQLPSGMLLYVSPSAGCKVLLLSLLDLCSVAMPLGLLVSNHIVLKAALATKLRS
jgi:hypothetical protein